jgi:hypothetical protein
MTHHKIILTIAAVLALSACTDKNPVAPTLTIKVTPPADYSANETIHLVGSFNDWALEGDRAYPLIKDNGGTERYHSRQRKKCIFHLGKKQKLAIDAHQRNGKKPMYLSTQSNGW